MKTNEQLETLIQNLIERMNRVEATVADSKLADHADNRKAADAIDQAIAALETAQARYVQTGKEYANIVAELKASTRKADGRLIRAH